MKNNNTKKLVMTGLLTALVFVGSRIGFHTPSVTGGGYVHLGTAVMFFTAFVFGRKAGAFAGGVGMGLFDLFSEYSIWAPFTLVIGALMGYFGGKIAYAKEGRLKTSKCFIAFLVCTLIKVVGYYITEIILYQNFISPFASVPGNIVQMVAGAIGGTLLARIFLVNKDISLMTN